MKFSVSVTFFCDGTGRDVTDGQTDTWTDRLFSENIILDEFELLQLNIIMLGKYFKSVNI